MNCTLRKLTNEMYNDKNNYYARTIGNYRVVRNLGYIYHYYFGNRICFVDLNNKEFALNHCGLEKFSQVHSQLEWLKKFYEKKGYKLVYIGF